MVKYKEKTQSSSLSAELFVKEYTKILEMIATGRSASKIYDAIALLYEAKHPGMRCSLLQLKDNLLMHGGAPSFPKEYCDAINGLENGPSVGSCGTSTYTGKQVLVENIETDPKWQLIKHHALPHGMRCCWSQPIKNTKGKTLGAFGMYYDHPALPNEEELSDLESAAVIAGIIMEREFQKIALRESEFKYGTLIENLPQRFFLKDKNSVFISCSKNLANDLGTTIEKIVGKDDFAFFPKAMAEHFQKDDKRIMQTGQTEEIEETIIIKGEERNIHTVKAPARDEEGYINGVLGIYWDITDQKALEANFIQAQKMDAFGTLVGGVAHEFNNALAGITGRLYLAKQHNKDNPQVSKNLNIISSLCDRSVEMIQQLLAFSRKKPVTLKVLDLNEAINESLNIHKFSIPENIKVETQLYSHELPVKGDINQLQQIFINTLNNARDALTDVSNGQINISVTLFKADKKFNQRHENKQQKSFAQLTIEDNGCGIPQADLDHIFEPFFSTKETGKGTGLGLAMLYGAVQTHKGFIDVKSEINKGTKFDIYFPLSEMTINEKGENEQKNEVYSGNGETILFVDDESAIRLMGEDLLSSLGYSTLQASNGYEAVNIYKSKKDHISLIIMDIVMPEMSGVEAASVIQELNNDVKIIFSTGYDKEEMLEDEQIGHYPLITKPYNVDEFSQLIRDTLLS